MKEIAIHGGDFDIDIDLDQLAAASGQFVDATGVSPVVGFFSAVRGGDTEIDATLRKTLTARTGALSRYFATLQGGDVLTHLTSLLWQEIYLCQRVGTAADPDFEMWTKYRVVEFVEG